MSTHTATRRRYGLLRVLGQVHETQSVRLNSGPSAAPAMPGPKTVKGAQSDPNYVSGLLLDCVSVFHKIITPPLLYRSGPVAIYYSEMFARGPKIIVTPLRLKAKSS